MSSTVADLVATFMVRHPADAASVLDQVEPSDTGRLLTHLDGPGASGILERMSPDAAARVLDELDDGLARRALAATDFVRLASILVQLGAERRARLLALLSVEQHRHVADALDYPAGSAGQLMDPKVMTFREDQTVTEVIERLRRTAVRGLSDLFLVDADGLLTGVVSLQDLVAAEETRTMQSLPQRVPLFVNPMASRDEVVALLRRHNLATLAVVDLDRRVLGVLRHDALLQAAEQAATDDLQQMVGADKDERALSTPLFTVKSRLPWLMINLGTGFLAATVVGLFDATIAKFTALAVLMPVVAGQAGNTGAQSLAVVSRGLALREIRLGHAMRVFRKETLAAAINGTAVAAVTALGTLLWSRNAVLALVIGTSMVGSMVIAATAGAAVPIVLTALKRDPATASSIVLTTITDITGFSSFLGLATLLSELLAKGTPPH
jgi:magnesium transporter